MDVDPVASVHPRAVLLGAPVAWLPVCDHYSGTEERMRKSLQLQAELHQAYGTCVMDVTLDCEDGAPVGGEAEHAALVTALALAAAPEARVAVRVHAVDHPAFANDVAQIVARAGHRLCHVMLPKVESVADVERAVAAIDAAGATTLPVHALIESPRAVHQAYDIAAHPRVQSLSFGLMDFVSAHGGAIPAEAMTAEGQFTHPLVLRAKLEIAAACHAHGKVPAHGVVTEFSNQAALRDAARRAARTLGYTRMWSIHPAQVRTIIEAFAPEAADVEQAERILTLAAQADWGPVSVDGVLHDRASYRYWWQVIERAHRTGRPLGPMMQAYFDPPLSDRRTA